MFLTREKLRTLRLAKSGVLSGVNAFCGSDVRSFGYASPTEVCESLLGVQAQVITWAGVSIAIRTTGRFSESTLEECLTQSRDLLRVWGQRHTLHVYPTTLWKHVLRGFGRPSLTEFSSLYKKFTGIGGTLDALEQLIDIAEELISEEGKAGMFQSEMIAKLEERVKSLPKVSKKLRSNLRDPVIRRCIMVELLLIRGSACYGKYNKTRARVVMRDQWLSEAQKRNFSENTTDDESIAHIADTYFKSYGPASIQDFAHFCGVSVTVASAWVEKSDVKLQPVDSDFEEYPQRYPLLYHENDMLIVAELESADPPRKRKLDTVGPSVLLLGRYDPHLLAYKVKSWVIPRTHISKVWKKAAVVEAVVLYNGEGAGTWDYTISKGGKITFTVTVWKDGALTEYDNSEIAEYVTAPAGRIAQYFGKEIEEITVVTET